MGEVNEIWAESMQDYLKNPLVSIKLNRKWINQNVVTVK
jgi:hypothetical protein